MKTKKLYYGAAYYDEYMPYDRVEKDMEMMEKAGMNLIRIAESTWSTWEPEEGHFDFSHLHRMLNAAKRHHISVIVGTPTYAIPTWLVKKDPTILAITHDGPQIYGHRQNMDITNETYLHHAEIIIRKLMEEVKDEPHVIGFQLDNETKAYDTCGPRPQAMFVKYLKEKFPDIKEFNREFGFDYWSNRIDDWDNFPDVRGTINQSLAAEYSRFQRKLVTDFFAWQASIVEEYKRPDQFITQNFDYEWRDYSYGLQPDVDQFAAAKCMQVAGCDIYHPSQDELIGCEITACGNIARAIKRANYLVLETEAQGNQAWLAYPGQLRLQAYSHVANGANCVEYWHWHSIHNAIESYWKGVLSHDFSENETYRDCCRIGAEWKRIGDQIHNLEKKNRVAIVIDNASLTGLSNFPTETAGVHSYNNIMRWLADALFYMNIEYDMIPADKNLLGEYDCVLLPALYSATEEFLRGLHDYVLSGGNLVATCRSGFSDEYLKIYSDTQPHGLTSVFGIHYDQFTYPKKVSVTYGGDTSEAREWMELVTCDTAASWAQYEHPVWNRYTAVAQNDYGKGHALYLGTIFGSGTLQKVLADFFHKISLSEPDKIAFDVSYPVSVKQGINGFGERVVFLLNYSPAPQNVTVPRSMQELITGTNHSAGDSLTLEPWGVAIFK